MKIEVGLKLEGICYGCPRFSGRVVRQTVYGETVSAKVICYHEEACRRILEICGKEEEHGEIH